MSLHKTNYEMNAQLKSLACLSRIISIFAFHNAKGSDVKAILFIYNFIKITLTCLKLWDGITQNLILPNYLKMVLCNNCTGRHNCFIFNCNFNSILFCCYYIASCSSKWRLRGLWVFVWSIMIRPKLEWSTNVNKLNNFKIHENPFSSSRFMESRQTDG